ncbi:MAG: thermonuclease family protein [Planctomycetaceae bacterium]|jgi:micrococcal nuclease|nr:thermonuclease family protein [Planctomycetaceae bacterium]
MTRRKNPLSVTKVLNLRRKPKTVGGWISAIVILILAAVFHYSSFDAFSRNDSGSAPIPEGVYEVERCVDGDTLLLTNKVRIRLIGANTPETVKQRTPVEPFGPEASAYTKRQIARAGNRVRLTFDGTPVDKYERVLAMVWLGNSLLNEDLIRQGLAKAELQYNYSRSMKNRFQKAEKEAKSAKRGIWSQPN